MVNKINKAFYNTVLCQAFSSCGNYLIVGDIYGTLSIFHLSKLIHASTNLSPDELKAKSTITVKEDFQINSLVTTPLHLIVGGVGTIYAYSWKHIKNGKNVLPVWTIDLPNNQEGFNRIDVNSLLYNDEHKQIYAGCGDNNVYLFDVECRKLLKVFSGHEDYVHSICSFANEIISGGEDGLVNIWDVRSGNIIGKIIPHADDKIKRAELGNWIGAVSCNEDYVLCGGGPRLSLWHYRFLTNSSVFPIEDKGIHVAEIYNDTIFAGGRSQLFYQMSFVGDINSEIPTAAITTYSAIHQEDPFTVLSIAGSCPKIDICSNFSYKDQQLSLY